MPFKRFQKRKAFSKRSKTLKGTVARLTRAVRMRKPELKYQDISNVLNASYNGTTIDLCAQIVQGQTDSTRIGDKIRLVGWQIRYVVVGNIASANISTFVRVLVTQVKQEAGTTPTLATVLQSTGAAASYLYAYNHDLREKFSVKYDKTVCVSNAALAGWPQVSHQKHFGKLNSMTAYSNGSAVLNNNGLYLMYLSDVAANTPVITFVVRVWYTDA